MSDEGLRELERTWRASRNPADEARFLAEALRRGRLVRERLELAAYLRHEPARLALGAGAPAGEHVPWAAWVAAVDDDGRRALARALVACVRAWRGLEEEGLLAACEVLEGWLAAPGIEQARAVRAARDALRVDPFGPEALLPEALARATAAWRLREACLLVLAPGPEAVEGALMQLARAARDGAIPWLEDRVGPIVDPVLAWALGPGHTWVPSASPPPGRPDAGAGPYLRERLRRGEVSLGALRLAAYAGDPAARDACGDAAPDAPSGLEGWVAGLDAFDVALAPRVVAGLAGHALPRPIRRVWFGAPATPRGHAARADAVGRANAACQALRSWAEAPTSQARAALGDHAERLSARGVERAAPNAAAERQLAALLAALACGRGEREPGSALQALLAALAAEDSADDLALLARGLVAGWARLRGGPDGRRGDDGDGA